MNVNTLNVKRFLAVTIIGFITTGYYVTQVERRHSQGRLFKTLKEALEAKADSSNNIVTALVDWGYFEMVLNLYETSLLPNKLTNYLFVCSDVKACEELPKLGFDCFLWYNQFPSGTSKGPDFNRKGNQRTLMVGEMLELGYNVLLLDVDVIIYKDPFPHFKHPGVDMFISTDCTDIYAFGLNAGFYFIRSTPAAKEYYQRMIQRIKSSHFLIWDQQVLNEEIPKVENFSLVRLSTDLYQPGCEFLVKSKRMMTYGSPCEKCIMVHYNFFDIYQEKRYLMKLNNHWMVDSSGYYSDKSGRYLTYANPPGPRNNETAYKEFMALVAAFSLGEVLNRTVILPKFTCSFPEQCHCYNTTATGNCYKTNGTENCNLSHYFDLVAFDLYFYNKYREYYFLSHRKVPEEVKMPVSTIYSILSSGGEIKSFGKMSDSVLNFDRLDDGVMPMEMFNQTVKNQLLSAAVPKVFAIVKRH